MPSPTEEHQSIVFYLWQVVHQFVTAGKLGKVLGAPLRVKLWEDKFREPDVVFMLEKNKHRRKGKYWEGADLVMKVASEDDPDRDLKKKRAEYAKAGILEYWIVDPRNETVTVLTLGEGESEYTVAGTYGRGGAATSQLLSGLSIDVDTVFSQA